MFCPLFLVAQQDDLTQEKAFFDEQAESYNGWLQSAGLGSLLSVKEVKVEANALSIYLTFPTEELNFAVNAWKTLKANFEAEEPLTLEQQLFYKALRF